MAAYTQVDVYVSESQTIRYQNKKGSFAFSFFFLKFCLHNYRD